MGILQRLFGKKAKQKQDVVTPVNKNNLGNTDNTKFSSEDHNSTGVYSAPISVTVEYGFPSSTHPNGKAEPSSNGHYNYQKATFTPDDYVVLDFETTGLNAEKDAIIQIGAIRFRNHEPIEHFISFVNPKRPIPSKITDITGITDKDVKDAPTIEEIFPDFIQFLKDDVLIAHNAPFDMKFLLSNARRLGIEKPNNPVIDTLTLARKYIPETPNHQLETLKQWLQLEVSSHHALDDCLTCAAVYRTCQKRREEKFRLSDDEKRAYDIVLRILSDHNRDTSLVRYSRTSIYLDIHAFYSFARIKLTGKKKYLLSKRLEREILDLCPNVICEPASKSEAGHTRILIQTPDDLLLASPLIVKDFDKALKSTEDYRKYVGKAEKVIQEYLSL
ncbi:3'-5' exonuclease [Geobacillus stearothermophilus]|uniref:3'-5' exonuclease n=1 Tax=Geobacillus stearothermophilus TaxID=1422 RepID=UPI002E1C0995|nr:3'-5' exonuclease [Geobacillus stearothermophilus]MED3783014.1 3'-5' exonuclease [Geobacillus stearothermophilus]MED4830665.1 3'-5' exonuclease [Geobacillus stearothermophilus]MED4960289.1 3'-5' exonuclease [Geobacillus stearothermophilus]